MASGYLKWTPEEFKAEVVRRLEERSQVVGEFVRSDARERLGKIDDPDWGEAYRNFVSGLLTFTIESNSREVKTTVGVKGGYTEWHGFYIEMGTSRQPPHPFLRPAVFSNLKQIASILEG